MRRQLKRASNAVIAGMTLTLPFTGFAQEPGNSSGAKTTGTTRKPTPSARRVTAGKTGSNTKLPVGKNPTVSAARAGDFTRPSSLPRITPPVAVVAPLITYFTQDTKDWLRAGDVMHVTMQGTQGGQAAFRIGPETERIAMQEVAPGQYIGSWTVPSDKPVMPSTPVMGELSVNGKNAIGMQTSRPAAIDTDPPRIVSITPAPQSAAATLTPTIAADFSDAGSGVNASSARLLVNGRDLTGEANVTTERIVYKPIVPLLEGDQIIQILVSDKAGNKSQQTWHFTAAAK